MSPPVASHVMASFKALLVEVESVEDSVVCEKLAAAEMEPEPKRAEREKERPALARREFFSALRSLLALARMSRWKESLPPRMRCVGKMWPVWGGGEVRNLDWENSGRILG